MNIGFFVGEQVSFSLSERRRDQRAYNGADIPFLLLQALANNDPKNTYFVLMRCADYEKYTNKQYRIDFPHMNVAFIANNYDLRHDGAFKPAMTAGKKMNPKTAIALQELEEELIELGGIDWFISCNMLRDTTIPGQSRLKKAEEFSAGRISSNRNTMIGMYFVNKFKTPYFATATDDRFLVARAPSLTNAPKMIFGYEDKTLTYSLLEDLSYESYRDNKRIDYDVPVIYNGADVISLQSLTRGPIPKKKSAIALYLNQHPASSYDRYACMKEYILDNELLTEVEIYGSWHDTHPQTKEDERFKGNLTRSEMMEDMKYKKYTFIIPSNEGITLASSKVWECLHTGVIPFLHKNYGGKEWREFWKFPSWIWIESPEDLKNKIAHFEQNPEAYHKALVELLSHNKDEYYNGKFLSNQIKKEVAKFL